MDVKYTYENILTLTKSLCMLYINGVIESANQNIRDCLLDGLDANLCMQDDIYQTMSDDGYYKIQNLEKKEVDKLLKKLKKSE